MDEKELVEVGWGGELVWPQSTGTAGTKPRSMMKFRESMWGQPNDQKEGRRVNRGPRN